MSNYILRKSFSKCMGRMYNFTMMKYVNMSVHGKFHKVNFKMNEYNEVGGWKHNMHKIYENIMYTYKYPIDISYNFRGIRAKESICRCLSTRPPILFFYQKITWVLWCKSTWHKKTKINIAFNLISPPYDNGVVFLSIAFWYFSH